MQTLSMDMMGSCPYGVTFEFLSGIFLESGPDCRWPHPGMAEACGCVKTCSPPGPAAENTRHPFPKTFSSTRFGAPLETSLIYYFLTDRHSIFQMIKQENL